jgi:hypothetical protein
VDHLRASFLQLVSMSRTASSLASDRASYGSSASKSECPKQQVLREASVWRGLVVVDCQPKNSSKCKRGAGSTATDGSRRSIAGLVSDARCAGSSLSSVVFTGIMSRAGSSLALAWSMVMGWHISTCTLGPLELAGEEINSTSESFLHALDLFDRRPVDLLE